MSSDVELLSRSTLLRVAGILTTVSETRDQKWFDWLLDEIEEHRAALRILDKAQSRAATNRWDEFNELLDEVRREAEERRQT